MPTQQRPPDEQHADVERAAYRQRLDVFLTSRDAGNQLTSDALRAGITLRTVVAAAADVAHYADDALAIVHEEYHPRIDCREGCAYCCRKPGVLASVPELLRILHHVRSTFDADTVAALAERARRYVSQMAGRSVNDFVNESVPCPLLVDERCSVYDVRPLVCRGYNSTSVDACRRAHEDARVTIPIFTALKDVTDGATVGAAQRLNVLGFKDAMLDVGTALNVALSAGDGFVEAAAETGEGFAPAEHPTWVADLWTRVRETARQLGISHV